MSKTAFMRGLQNFISDIRGCQNKEMEQKRVDKELAKIREKFGDDKGLSGYDRRKYVWKLLYIYMLGYDIDFGHKQACDLIPSQKYKDKQVGYMACSLLFQENDEFLRLAINGIHKDLTSRNEAFECLALNFVGSVGGAEMAEALTQDIMKLLTSGASRPIVKKRAALCLLKMIRKTPNEQQVVQTDSFCSIISSLLEEQDLGLLLSTMTLLYGILLRSGPAGYESLQGRVIRTMDSLMTGQKDKTVPAEYLYYGIPSPWLQCRTLRVLQFYPAPENPADRTMLISILQTIINAASVHDANSSATPAHQNKANATNSILFEAIALALSMNVDSEMLNKAVATLGQFLTVKEANVKYLALENLSRLAAMPEILAAIRQHKTTVTESLRDPDISIRRRSLDLLFTMCDQSNVQEIVGELLQYLVTADFTIQEELVLKTAILAEKFAPSVQWYVDVLLQLLERAGEFVSDNIWHRVIQLVSNNDSMQQYAARNVVETVKRGARNESLICVSAYILGEFGRQIQAETPAAEQFRLLHTLFPAASTETKGLLLTSYIKILMHDPNNMALKTEVTQLFERYKQFVDAELQQRATEYLSLAGKPQIAATNTLLPMPKWPERESSLLRQLQKAEGVAEDRAANSISSPAKADGDVAAPHFLVAPAAAAPSAQSIDLLGGESLPTPNNAYADPFSDMAGPAPVAASTDPLDMLSDLMGDSLQSSRAAPLDSSLIYQQQLSAAAPFPDMMMPPAATAATQSMPFPGAPTPAVSFANAQQPVTNQVSNTPGAAAALLQEQQQNPGAFDPFAAPNTSAAAMPQVPSYGAPAPSAVMPQPQSYGAPAPAAVMPQPQSYGAPAPSAVMPQPQSYGAPAPAAAMPQPQSYGAPAPATAMPQGQSYQAPAPPASDAASRSFDPFAPTSAPAPALQHYDPFAPPPAAVAAAAGVPAGATTSAVMATNQQPAQVYGFDTVTIAPAGPSGGVAMPPAQPPIATSSAPPMAPSLHATSSVTSTSSSSMMAPAAVGAATGVAAAAVATWGASAFPAEDLFGDSAFAPPAPQTPQYEPARPIGDINAWYSALLFKSRGVLYEDQYLQIGLQSTYTRSQGEIIMYLGNKNGEQPLQNLSFVVTTPSPSVQVIVGPAPAVLAPKQQMQVPLQVVSLMAGSEPPAVQLSYTLANVSVNQHLRLPVANHKFMVPDPSISPDLFFGQWRALGQPPNRAQEMLDRAGAVSVNQLIELLRGLNFGVEHGSLDPSPCNEAGAAHFFSGPPGQEQPTMVMCRIEGNPQTMAQFRVTVESAQPVLSETLKEQVAIQLRTLPSSL